ncbi:MAG: hypothetical protein IPG51_14425 [Chloroflexi bacterium]|nr:hypothetical protein [Chloroflexota bacterium]
MDRILPRLEALSPADVDPVLIGLTAVAGTVSSRQRKAWINWLMGGRRVRLQNKALPKGVQFPPSIKSATTPARSPICSPD